MKAVYVLATIVVAVGWLVVVISAFSKSAGSGFLFLVLGSIGAVLYLAVIRMTMEFYLAIVRMSQDIHQRLPSR